MQADTSAFQGSDGSQSLRGRVALITGASGGGVGTTSAQLLAQRGADVVVNYLANQASAEQIAAEIVAAGRRARAIQADVGNKEQVEHMVAEVLEAFGRLDILVNSASAGRFHVGRFEEQSWTQFSEGIEVRLRPAYLLTQAVLPAMRQQGGGRLIYVGSEHADGPIAWGMIANGTSAAALVAFVRYVAHELGPYGITANVVSPGGIDTPATRRALSSGGMDAAGFIQRVSAAVPLGRMTTPRDVAGAVAFFASDDAAYITGTVAHVSGGFGIARLPAAGDARSAKE